jgi:CshA-type fibril repeat protein
VADAEGNVSEPATVTVAADPVPVATDDVISYTPGQAVTVNVVANDTTGDTVIPSTVSIVGSTGNTLTVAGEGTWSVNPTTGAITFTPEVDFTGDPTPIQYTVADAEGNVSEPATVTVAADPVPIATDDVTSYTPGQAVTVNVVANDTSGDAVIPSTVSIVGSTENTLTVAGEGTWTVNPTTGAITFTPVPGFTSNPTPIQYTVQDDDGDTSVPATITLTANCTATTGKFSGIVWRDTNYNDAIDNGETALANVPVTLAPQGITTGQIQIRVTGADGAFAFNDVPIGSYLLQVQDANLNVAHHLYPTASSLLFTSLAACEHKIKNYGYAPTQIPVIGDFVWYDVNGNGTQDEWYDANNDGLVTKNNPVALVNMANWEWIDLNGDNSYAGAANEGELNKCGFGQAISTGNVWATNAATSEIKKVIVGIQGYWRTRPPDYGTYDVALNLIADNGALLSAAQAMVGIGKCKVIGAPATQSLPQQRTGLVCGPTGGADGYNVILADPGVGNPQPERLDVDFGINCTQPQPLTASIELDKTLYRGHGNNAAACNAGVDELVVVDAQRKPQKVTYCFKITNTGQTYLKNLRLEDLPLEPSFDQVLLKPAGLNTLILAPGAAATFFYQTSLSDSVENVATVTATPSNANGVATGTADVQASDNNAYLVYIFDPPFGVKTVTATGQVGLAWTMVWINASSKVAKNAEVSDSIPVGTTYAGNLSCVPHGDTETDAPVASNCTFEPVSAAYPRGRVIWRGTMAADGNGATVQTAQHSLEIKFDVTLNNPTVQQTINNQGTLTYDVEVTNNQGTTTVSTASVVTSNAGNNGNNVNTDPTSVTIGGGGGVAPPKPLPIPALSPAALILLILSMMLIAFNELRIRERLRG